MIEDGSHWPAGTTLRADLCVVGAGPAGIALALSAAARGRQVLLLEAGRAPLDPFAQSLYEGEPANDDANEGLAEGLDEGAGRGSLHATHAPPHRFRMRGLGGSSIRWGGRCMPLDPIDFEPRAWVAHGGWPIGPEDLAPYYAAASEWAEAGHRGAPDYDSPTALPHAPPLIAGFNSEVLLTRSLERFSCPTDFGRRYRRRMQVEDNLRVITGLACTGIRLAPSGRRVASLALATPQGRRLSVRAGEVVLATGGLETARLLLASDDVAPRGVGNRHDVVGRFYMCHLAANLGALQLAGEPGDVRHGYEVAADGVYCRRRLTVAPAHQRHLRLLNAVARLHFPEIADPAHRSGVLSGLYLARRCISYEYGRRLQDTAPPSLAQRARHVANVARDWRDTAAFLSHWVRRRSLAARKFPSVILRNRANRFSLEVQAEQVPHPDSRITLAAGADALGQRRLRVDWRWQPQDIDSVRRTLEVMAGELARGGAGRLRFDADRLPQDLLRYGAYGGHHLGTARMGLDPRTSVVDAQCRVHEVDNLYIAGSAVFPTAGQANPTLTVLALALRLADHLASAPAAAAAPPRERSAA